MLMAIMYYNSETYCCTNSNTVLIIILWNLMVLSLKKKFSEIKILKVIT